MGQTVPNVDAKGSVLKVSTSYWFVWERSRSQRVSDLPFLWRGEAAPLGFGFLTEAANRQNRRGFILVYYNLFEEGNTFTSSVLRARGGTQDMWTWITRQKLETLDKKSTRLGLQRQLFPSKLTLTAFQYLYYYYYYYVPIWSMWNAVCQKGQDVPLHLVTFCSLHSFCSVLFWIFWPTLLRPAKHVTVRRMNIKQSRESRRTFDSSLAAHSSVGTFFFVLQNVVLMPR